MNLNLNDLPEWLYINKDGKLEVSRQTLYTYLKSNLKMKISDKGNIFLYESNVYRQLSVREFKFIIKEHIPVEIRTNQDWEAVWKEFSTDMPCNPLDYYKYIFPAITIRNADGEYVTRTALPVEFIPEASVDEGEAVFGIGLEYFLGVVFGGETGAIDFSDHAKFAEDMRLYMTKLLADGRPKNNSSFVRLDITGLANATA